MSRRVDGRRCGPRKGPLTAEDPALAMGIEASNRLVDNVIGSSRTGSHGPNGGILARSLGAPDNHGPGPRSIGDG